MTLCSLFPKVKIANAQCIWRLAHGGGFMSGNRMKGCRNRNGSHARLLPSRLREMT